MFKNIKNLIYMSLILSIMFFITGCLNNNITGNLENVNKNSDVNSNNNGADTNIDDNDTIKDNKIKIITTMFPTYDFSRSIIGDKGEVTMLIKPGLESHSYEPSPKDIININSSNLFIYTGENMETWAKVIIDSLDNKELTILDVSKDINLLETSHNHEHDENIDEYNEMGDKIDNEEHEEHEHNFQYDPHIWTDPINCTIIVNNILSEIVKLDETNKDYYEKNAYELIDKLYNLDLRIKEIVKNGKRNELVFGTRFALLYFTNRYNLTYKAAYDTCSTEVEPSVKQIIELTNEIKNKQIPVIYYEELTEPKVARSIAKDTNTEMLLFHSCHNVTKDEFEKGVTYFDLMEQNLINLTKGLN